MDKPKENTSLFQQEVDPELLKEFFSMCVSKKQLEAFKNLTLGGYPSDSSSEVRTEESE